MEQKTDYITESQEALEMLGKGYVYEPRKIIQEISGFYPLFEVLLDRYGDLITPAVFGVAWRFCQMEDGVCKASLRTMAGILNISEATVMRRLEILCAGGYLKDLTPDLKHKPHIYADTGKVVMRSALGTVESVSQGNTSVSGRNRSVSRRNRSVSQSQLNKDLNKDSIKGEGREPAAPRANQIPEIALFRKVAGRYPSKPSFQTVINAISQIKVRLGRDVTEADLLPFLTAWTDKSWNPMNLAWLTEWAVPGQIPQRPNGHKPAAVVSPNPVQPELSPDELERRRAEVDARFREKGLIR